MPRSAVATHHFEALGTNCSLFAVGVPPGRLLEGEFWVRRTGARLTRFSQESELSRFNASPGRWIEISPELESLLVESLHAFDTSSGLVNVAVLPSLQAAGYTRPLSEGQPIATELQARPLPALRDVLAVRAGTARLEPGAGIDLGGIAKGWMADRLLDWLGPNALANLGGDLSAHGTGPAGVGWPVGLGGATVLLRDQAAATSSVRRRRWSIEHHHLIDPRTGLPARTGLEEVSVVAATGVEAEVVAKTALLVGPEVAPAYCAAHALAWWLSP
ncbi:MAG TPA: FAD:protein FMN transferase [Candidatus Dormibacteraeota bacterium]|jgi:thiamine biosynthesis lipoprotein|nr:FAD:protein FMN transferase [Candidatus Dormibacteraeota bacterium]